MEWSDEGIVLTARRHGESAAVVSLLTRGHGRHAGLVHGGGGKAKRAMLQPGNRVAARWRGRLAEQLGVFAAELVKGHAAAWFDDPARLACVAAVCALVETALPEREAHAAVFDGTDALLEALAGQDWPTGYVLWEMGLLRELGYGLDLANCAVTGGNDQLAYVSPRSGRAVSLSAGEAWRDRLLPLPGFLVHGGAGDRDAVLAGLRLTGYFLDRHVLAPHDHALPAARARLVDRLSV